MKAGLHRNVALLDILTCFSFENISHKVSSRCSFERILKNSGIVSPVDLLPYRKEKVGRAARSGFC